MMEATPTEMDQGLAARRGFAKAISLSASQADIDNLKIALAFEEGQKEIKQRVVEVNAALKLLAKEIDRVGQDRKRGKNTPFKKITSDFIEVQTQFAQEIMDNYYESLLKYSQDISPDALSEISEIDTPETALARNLPNLSKDKYSGVSHRVWTRLRKRHGKKIDAPSQAGGSAGLPELPELPESQEPDANPDDTDGSKK